MSAPSTAERFIIAKGFQGIKSAVTAVSGVSLLGLLGHSGRGTVFMGPGVQIEIFISHRASSQLSL